MSEPSVGQALGPRSPGREKAKFDLLGGAVLGFFVGASLGTSTSFCMVYPLASGSPQVWKWLDALVYVLVGGSSLAIIGTVVPRSRKLLAGAGISLVAVLFVLFAIPATRSAVVGLLRNESFFLGRPESYWLQRLNSEDRQQAIESLSNMGSPALPMIKEALNNSDPKIRQGAIKVLGRWAAYGSESAGMIELQNATQHEDATVRLGAVEELSKLHQYTFARSVLPTLERALGDTDEAVRQAAAKGMERVDPAAAAEKAKAVRVTKENWQRLGAKMKEGVTIEQVHEALGNPDSTFSTSKPNPFGKKTDPFGDKYDEIIVWQAWYGKDVNIKMEYEDGKVTKASLVNREKPD